MAGNSARLRKRAIIRDVVGWVDYAMSSGFHTNPFAEDDKRHSIFASKLNRALQVEDHFRDLENVYGSNPPCLSKIECQKPEFLTLDQLLARCR